MPDVVTVAVMAITDEDTMKRIEGNTVGVCHYTKYDLLITAVWLSLVGPPSIMFILVTDTAISPINSPSGKLGAVNIIVGGKAYMKNSPLTETE